MQNKCENVGKKRVITGKASTLQREMNIKDKKSIQSENKECQTTKRNKNPGVTRGTE